MRKVAFLVLILLAGLVVHDASAAFMVEPYDGSLGGSVGRDYDNFSGTPRWTNSLQSSAPGISTTYHAYGSTGTEAYDVYVFSYTPGEDLDNWMPEQYLWLGNDVTATGLEGGQTGYYNVFITWPESTNVDLSGSNIEVAYDGGSILWENVNVNTGGTGTPGANNAWLRLADNVLLTEGMSYTVTQTSNSGAWVSQRVSGVMWEFVEVPEPATLSLLIIGTLALRRRRVR